MRDGKGEASVKGVSTDSRKIQKGEVFFALKGPNFDGHSFVEAVFGKGARAAVVEQAYADKSPGPGGPLILVDDTLKALGDLASYARRLYRETPVVAVSGSAGKTTTKDMTAAILSVSRPVMKTEGNLNNLIGLPLTLLGLTAAHGAAVVELGISLPGEMKRLSEMASPDVAVLTNIGRGHLKTLGSIERVAREKGELFRSVGPEGFKVVNLDDPWTVKMAEEAGKGRPVTFSLKDRADVRAMDYSVEEGFGGIRVTYEVRGERLKVRLNTPALCNVSNAAAAICAAVSLGATLKEAGEGLASGIAAHGRMEVVRINGLTVLDDTYNANPESVAAALLTLKRATGRKIAVLGDMRELGEASVNAHREAGKMAAEYGIDMVVAIGAFSKEITEGASSGGLSPGRVMGFGGKMDAVKALKGLLREGDSILVKGSRAVALEEVVETLKRGFLPDRAYN